MRKPVGVAVLAAAAVSVLIVPGSASGVIVKPPAIEEQLGHPQETPAPNNPPAIPAPAPPPVAPAEPQAAPTSCLVPALKGLTVHNAASRLTAAHCTLGRITKPRHHHGKLVVTAQSVHAGTTLPGAAIVSITLGVRPGHKR